MSIDWRDFPSLTALRAFHATAREGGFAGAARALNVTHAAVAQQVRALEADLGTRLAVRRGRRVELTDAGRTLDQALGEGFAAIAGTVNRLRGAAQTRGLRVTTTPFLTERVIMPRLRDFWAAHPGAEISVTPTRVFVDVVGEGYDLAIRAVLPTETLDVPEVDWTPVGTASVIAIATPDLVARHPDPHEVPWLWHDSMGTKIRLMESCGLEIDRLTRTRIGSPNLLLEAARQGLGATLFNERIAREEIAAGGLAQVPLPSPGTMTYWAGTPKGPRHPLAEPFADWVGRLLA